MSPVDYLTGSLGAEVGTEPRHTSETEGPTSKTTAQFKSFLGDEGYHAPPLSSNLSTSEIKQQLFDFSLGRHLLMERLILILCSACHCQCFSEVWVVGDTGMNKRFCFIIRYTDG